MSSILIIEDSLTDMQIITEFLKTANFEIFSATNCQEATNTLASNSPDLVILDVILPDRSGFEMCRSIKENPKTSQIPVIMCSTKNTEADKVWGTMLGADAYISKPIDRQSLLKVIEGLIKK